MIPCKLIQLMCTWALLLTYNVDAVKKLTTPEEYGKLYEIENGYEKSNSKSVLIAKSSITKNMVHEERNTIMCGFTFIALSYMHIAEYLLRWDGEDRIDAVIDHIEPLGQHAYKMNIVLYNIGFGQSMFDMWMFYLYVSKIQLFRAYINSESESTFKKNLMDMYDIHVSIMEKLKKNVWRCRHNRLYVDSRMSSLFNRFKFLSRSDDITMAISMIKEQSIEVSKLIANNEHLAFGTENAEYLKIDRLYLNDLVLRDDIMDELQNGFDRNITWGNTNDILKNTWANLKDNPLTTFEGLSGFQKYHWQFKNVIKTVLLRIIWSHLLILERQMTVSKLNSQPFHKILLNSSTVSNKNNKLLKIIKPLLYYLELQADDDLKVLVKCLKKEPWSCLTDKLGVALISEQLKRMELHFEGLIALVGVLCEEDELKDKYRDWTKLAEKKHLSVKFLPVKKFTSFNINFTRVVIFSEYVRHILENVDFKLMKKIFESSNVTSFDGHNSSQIPYKKEISVSTGSNFSSEDNTESKQSEINDDDIEVLDNVEILSKIEYENSDNTNLEESSSVTANKSVCNEIILEETSENDLENSRNNMVENNLQKSSSEEKQETGEGVSIKIEIDVEQDKSTLKEDETGDSEIETLLNKNAETESDLHDTQSFEPDQLEISNKITETICENSENTQLEESSSGPADKSISNEIIPEDTSEKDLGNMENSQNDTVENNERSSSKSTEEKQETGERENIKIEIYVEHDKSTLKEDETGDDKMEIFLNNNVITENDLIDTQYIEPDQVEISNKIEEIKFENSENTHLKEFSSVPVDKSISNEIISEDTSKKDLENSHNDTVENNEPISSKSTKVKQEIGEAENTKTEKNIKQDKGNLNGDEINETEISNTELLNENMESDKILSDSLPVEARKEEKSCKVEGNSFEDAEKIYLEDFSIVPDNKISDEKVSEDISGKRLIIMEHSQIKPDKNDVQSSSSSFDEKTFTDIIGNTRNEIVEHSVPSHFNSNENSEVLVTHELKSRRDIHKLEEKIDSGNVAPEEMQVNHGTSNDTERTHLNDKKPRSIELTDNENIHGLDNKTKFVNDHLVSNSKNNVDVEDTNDKNENIGEDIKTRSSPDYGPKLFEMNNISLKENTNEAYEISTPEPFPTNSRSLQNEHFTNQVDLQGWQQDMYGFLFEAPGYSNSIEEYNKIVNNSPSDAK